MRDSAVLTSVSGHLNAVLSGEQAPPPGPAPRPLPLTTPPVTLLTVGRCRVFDPQPGAASRIPMSRGLKTSAKAGAAVATVTRMESRSEGQLMKIELRRSAGCGPASSSGGKS